MAMTPPTQPLEDAIRGKTMLGRLRTYFFTGLIILAPVAITVWATIWFVGVFDDWIKPLVPQAYNPDSYLPFKVPGTGLVFALLIITLAGFLGANLVGRTIIGWWDGLVTRTPVVRSIYKGSKQIFETMFSEKGASFQKVCLVEWPRRDAWSVAFVSRAVDGKDVGLEAGRAMYAIYVSTTPNPTSGYVFFADQADVRILDMTVEDGLKLVISMGLVFPEKAPTPELEAATAAALPPIQPARKRRTASSRPKR
jgi:uncharacterized membrane protein